MTRIDVIPLVDHLAAASVEGAALVAVAWIAFCLRPAVSPAVRTVVWWLVALKFVIALLPLPAVSLPVLPAALRPAATPALASPVGDARRAGETRAAGTVEGGALGTDRRPALAGVASPGPVGGRPAGAPERPLAWADWRWIVLAAWAFVVAGHAVRLRSAARHLRRLLARAVRWSEEERDGVRPLARRLGLARLPEIRTSSEVEVPLVAGVLRPVVLVPAGRFTAAERALMLAHELAHVRRRDLAWGWVPAAAERLFFFHPLARLAVREYLIAREAACDADVIRTLDIASADYGRLLVRLGVSRPGPAFVASGSSPSMASLKRRLEMLHSMPGTPAPRAAWIIALAVAALLPLQLGARQAPQAPREGTPARESSAPASAQRALQATSSLPGQRVGIHEDSPAAPGIEAMLHAVEEQSRRGADLESTLRAAHGLHLMTQPQEVVHVLDWHETIEVQREIERSLQELTAEIGQVRARRLPDEAERLRVAEEQASTGSVTPDAREAIRLEIERAQRDANEAQQQRRVALDAIRTEFERARAEFERSAQDAAVARDLEERLTRARETVARLERNGLPDAHPDLAAARDTVRRLEREQASRATRQVERADPDRGGMVAAMRDQLEQLRREQEALIEQLQRLTAQQQAVIEAQRRLSDAADWIRRELEQR